MDESAELEQLKEEKQKHLDKIATIDNQIQFTQQRLQAKKESNNQPTMDTIFEPVIDEAIQLCIQSEERLGVLKPDILKVQAKKTGLTQKQLLTKINDYKTDQINQQEINKDQHRINDIST